MRQQITSGMISYLTKNCIFTMKRNDRVDKVLPRSGDYSRSDTLHAAEPLCGIPKNDRVQNKQTEKLKYEKFKRKSTYFTFL